MADRSATAARREALMRLLQSGRLWRGEDLAARLGVSLRTIHRDLALMGKAGLPVAGARGLGYVATAEIALPPLHLSALEMEALQAALSGLAATADDRAPAAAALLARIEGETGAAALRADPLEAAAGALPHLPALRRAIAARQKVRLGGRVLHPLRLAWWGGAWRLVAWDVGAGDFAEEAVHRGAGRDGDLAVLPELFEDRPGQRLEDYLAAG
ncbi:helix-turn-helix transcriptional regulator [Wenxinia saemankumensis]|uniref:Predicted DNA-binding transcriptional regulator YafY, contains an HTH and WYL domains n=1 Tax=Wenxinia saemankumensis TaxID=1447782 RepID=A0A1M6GXD6_9RHOB|nr:HTH domain-containing protein [Wenxinia saemankumensis]SHJ14567.1 Predicted DNA-binding transcriptional regulator YafY, contains an HTH and WYL domains [Wenxinia saemankumensis]